jgi:hypothetical protein
MGIDEDLRHLQGTTTTTNRQLSPIAGDSVTGNTKIDFAIQNNIRKNVGAVFPRISAKPVHVKAEFEFSALRRAFN